MSSIEAEKSEVAALNAKLTGARTEIQAKDKELNDLRNRVVKLEDKSTVDELEKKNESLGSSLQDVSARLADVEREAGNWHILDGQGRRT